jgi:hypothetical protein
VTVSFDDVMLSVAHWVGTRPLHTKVLFSVAVAVFLIELAFRRFSPHGAAYKKWTHAFEAIGAVWTTVILSLVYVISVGPIGLCFRLMGRDLLDRGPLVAMSAWKIHEPHALGAHAAARYQF